MTCEPDAAALLAQALGTTPPDPGRPAADTPTPADADDPTDDDLAALP